MSQLTIRRDSSMGPLEISVYPPDGDPIEFTLSSGLTQRVISAEAGPYAIVARRPDGVRLNKTVQVTGADETVLLSPAVGQLRSDSVAEETVRGQVMSSSITPSWLDAAAVVRRTRYPDANLVAASPAPETNSAKDLRLRLWLLDETGKWNAVSGVAADDYVRDTSIAGDVLTVGLDCRGLVLGLGLIDAQGFGPIVNVPPFAERVEVTFLSKGISVQAADRIGNPAGQRVPVAFITPSNHAAADLLVALASQSTPSAEAIWTQTLPGLAKPVDGSAAIDMLFEKFARPAEAMLGAHYLLRFLPKQLPVAWADNLVRVLPNAVDGPVIAAWARLLNRPEGAEDKEIDDAINHYIEMALTRPATLFARTRALLMDCRHLVSVDREAELWRRVDQFWRSGAGASGLECFWGGSPSMPGTSGDAEPTVDLGRVGLVDGAFTPASAHASSSDASAPNKAYPSSR